MLMFILANNNFTYKYSTMQNNCIISYPQVCENALLRITLI